MSNQRRGARALLGVVAALGLATLGMGAAGADEEGAPETPLERVNALVQPSIVYLQQDWSGYVYDKSNKQYLNNGMPFDLSFQCTGFVVNPDGYIATAGHCVDKNEVFPVFFETAAQWAIDNGYYLSTDLTIEDILGFQSYRVETLTKVNRADLVITVGWGAAASGIDTAEVRRARVVDLQRPDAGDVALLKVEATGLNALALSEEEVEVGTAIVSIGYPVSVDTVTDPDLTPSFKDGSVSSVKTVQGGLLTVYEISAAVSGGMSGGPTVDLEGNVVGVNSFGITGEPQAFNFVRPSEQVRELLAGAGVENVLSETTQTYREGLLAYWAGDKEAAVEALTAVVEEQPSNKLATEYLQKAKDLPDPEPPAKEPAEESGTPVLPIAIGAAALVVVAVGGLLVLRRGRRRKPPVAAAPTVVPGAVVPPAVPPPAPPPAALPSTPPPTVATGTAQAVLEQPAAAEPELPHFCGNCGDPTHPGERFCENCGTPLVH